MMSTACFFPVRAGSVVKSVVKSGIVVRIMALAACDYDAKIEDCRVTCTNASGCPSGYSCSISEGLCRTGAPTPTCAAMLDGASCNGLAATCGPGASDDCCSTATTIPGGTFFRSYDVATDGMYIDSSFPATVSTFRLDKYEATVGRFRRFVTAVQGTQVSPPTIGAGAHPNIPGSGWDASWNSSLEMDITSLVAAVKCNAMYQTWTDTPTANENRPINCITWYEAMAFCAWDGGYLPTEAEWNYAASGGDEQRAFPWSSPPGSLTIDCTYANYYPSNSVCAGSTTNVGSESPKGDGKWGQSDLGGNVWEWTLDWYATAPPYVNPCTDCANLTPATPYRMIRGGRLFSPASSLRSGYRVPAYPSGQDAANGFRCARSAR